MRCEDFDVNVAYRKPITCMVILLGQRTAKNAIMINRTVFPTPTLLAIGVELIG
jgi:hypothetical protein